jgi:hypothetical protein
MERDEDEENFLGIWGHVVLIAKFGGDAGIPDLAILQYWRGVG